MARHPPAKPQPDESPDRRAFLLRLPPEVMAELRAWAAQELRSLNGHIEYLLRDALRRRKREER